MHNKTIIRKVEKGHKIKINNQINISDLKIPNLNQINYIFDNFWMAGNN